MRIGLKYCGGCNPLYERSNIAIWLKRDFSNIVIEPIKYETQYDLVLMIYGCGAECAIDTSFCATNTITIHREKDYERVKQYLKQKGY